MLNRDAQIRNSGSWLYWVAALSFFNTLAVLFNWNFSFSIGLGVTMMAAGVGQQAGALGAQIGLAFTLVAVGLLTMLGFFACKGHVWAFIVGIAILTIDTLLLLPFMPETLLSVAFHAWAIFSLVSGMRAAARA